MSPNQRILTNENRASMIRVYSVSAEEWVQRRFPARRTEPQSEMTFTGGRRICMTATCRHLYQPSVVGLRARRSMKATSSIVQSTMEDWQAKSGVGLASTATSCEPTNPFTSQLIGWPQACARMWVVESRPSNARVVSDCLVVRMLCAKTTNDESVGLHFRGSSLSSKVFSSPKYQVAPKAHTVTTCLSRYSHPSHLNAAAQSVP